MTNVKPTTHKDGTETVELYGTTVDVTNKDSFTLFKREYTVTRVKKAKKTTSRSTKVTKADTEADKATNNE